MYSILAYATRFKQLFAVVLGAIGLLQLFSSTAAAQPYPNKPITVSVGYAPGGGLDSFCRMVMIAMSERMGQPMVVQNRPGADGHIGLSAVGKAAPDGYTLSCVPHSMTQSVHMKPLDINIFKDLAPVSLLVTWNWTLLVRPDLPVKNLQEFVASSTTRPTPYNFGTSGAAARLTAALLQNRSGAKLMVVPFTGTSPSLVAMMGGHVDASFAAYTEVAEFVKTGRLRALAVLAGQRISAAPDVPAITEFYPGFDPSAWYGLVGPGAMPKAIVDKLNSEFNAVLNEPGMSQKLSDRGWYPKTSTPQQFGELIRSDHERYGQVVKQYDIK
jgi:tripartite-type tricarboxylate transporter receptor subunit TctC